MAVVRPHGQRCLWTLVSLVSLAGVLILPSGVEALFDGLPWTRRPEFLVAAVVIPFLLILGRRFLGMRWAALAAVVLLVLKLVLALFAPPAGWDLRIYQSPQAQADGRWERTYASLLRPGLSEVLDKPLGHGREFPIEWMNRYDKVQRGQLRAVLEVAGWARVPAGSGLALVAGGLESGRAWASDGRGGQKDVPVLADLAQAAALDPGSLPGGSLRVNARLDYFQGNWTLIPVLVRAGGQVEPAFKQGVLWRSAAGAQIAGGWLSVLQGAAQVLDYALLAWLLAWALWTLASLWRDGLLNQIGRAHV